jgi:hypothetical protein
MNSRYRAGDKIGGGDDITWLQSNRDRHKWLRQFTMKQLIFSMILIR